MTTILIQPKPETPNMSDFDYKVVYEKTLVDRDFEGPFPVTALNVALKNKDEKTVNTLLDNGADPNIIGDYYGLGGMNALQVAANGMCSLPLFNRILGMIYNVNAGDFWKKHGWVGKTALMYAVESNRLDMVVSLMNHPDIDLNFRGAGSVTALLCAVDSWCPAIVSQLLSDDRIDTNIGGILLRGDKILTPLKYAIKKDDPCVNVLKDHILATAKKKYKGIGAAYEASDEEAAEALLDDGADPNKVDNYGRNALISAVDCSRPDLPVFNRILGMIHNVNARDEFGETALFCAARRMDVDAVVALMNRPDIDVNIRDCDNNTALHEAVRNDDTDILVELLCDDRIDTSLKDKNNKTPLQLAIDEGYYECVEILKKHSAIMTLLKLKC